MKALHLASGLTILGMLVACASSPEASQRHTSSDVRNSQGSAEEMRRFDEDRLTELQMRVLPGDGSFERRKRALERKYHPGRYIRQPQSAGP